MTLSFLNKFHIKEKSVNLIIYLEDMLFLGTMQWLPPRLEGHSKKVGGSTGLLHPLTKRFGDNAVYVVYIC